MEKFHRLIYRIDSNEIRSFFSQDLIGRMYRCLGQAPGMTDDPAIKRRIYDMILYTGYSERYLRYTQAKADEKQKYFEDLIRRIYRMMHTRMIDLVAAYLTLQDTAKDVTIPGSARWNVPEGKNPWKVKDPFSDEEILMMLKKGIEVNCLFEIEQVFFSEKIVPVKGFVDIIVVATLMVEVERFWIEAEKKFFHSLNYLFIAISRSMCLKDRMESCGCFLVAMGEKFC